MEEKNYSDQTALAIDREVRQIMESCYERAKKLLIENRAKLELLMHELLEKEVLDGEVVCKLVGITSKRVEAAEELGASRNSGGQEVSVPQGPSPVTA